MASRLPISLPSSRAHAGSDALEGGDPCNHHQRPSERPADVVQMCAAPLAALGPPVGLLRLHAEGGRPRSVHVPVSRLPVARSPKAGNWAETASEGFGSREPLDPSSLPLCRRVAGEWATQPLPDGLGDYPTG
jgi:hypothetical protein